MLLLALAKSHGTKTIFEHVMQHRAVQLISEEPLIIAFQFANQLNKHKGNRHLLFYSHKMVMIRVEA